MCSSWVEYVSSVSGCGPRWSWDKEVAFISPWENSAITHWWGGGCLIWLLLPWAIIDLPLIFMSTHTHTWSLCLTFLLPPLTSQHIIFCFFYLFFSSFPVSWYLTSPYSLWFHPMSFLLSFLSVFCFGFCPSQSCLSAQGCRIILSVISHSFILALAMSALSTMTPQFQENSSTPSPDLHASAWEKENNIWFFKVIFCDFLSFCCCCHCWSDKSYSPSKNFLFNFV